MGAGLRGRWRSSDLFRAEYLVIAGGVWERTRVRVKSA
jgi:hypothetical protein